MKKTILLFSALLIFGNLSAQDKAALVNPIIGTNGMGHTFPGACVPFGLVQLSPDTDTIPHNVDGKYQPRAYEYCAGYQHKDSSIVGFSHTHFSGTGHSDLGDILIMPATGELKLNPGTATDPDGGYRSRFSHDTEVSRPGYYEVMLADYGANVIKIEMPGKGDDTRAMGPKKNDYSMYYAYVNRGKKGITLNLKSEEGKKLFLEMVKKADVVVENYRPGVMDKLGVGYDVLKEVNDQIIYAAVSGFGCYGPKHQRPGYDIIAQATSGLMSITGEAGGQPLRVGNAMGDVLGGMNLTIGILMALNARTVTGRGQRVDVALVDSVVSSLEVGWQRFFASGKQPELIGNRYASALPYDSFQASDGRFVIGCGNDKLFTLLCTKALDRPDLLEDPRFDTNIHRCENYAALKPEIEKWSAQHTIADCVAIIDAAGVPVAPINMLADVVNDDHIANAREMFVHLQHPVIGDMIVPGNPVKLMDTKPEITKCAPDLGQDNKEIYEGVLGLSDADLARLKEEKVI